MIRYAFEQAWLESEIRKIDHAWLDKAKRRTQVMVEKGFFEEKSSIWHIVKSIYMKVQNNKCVFCERQFEGVDSGKIEHDLEHFRPKGKVDAWPAGGNSSPRYDFATGDEFAPGYYWLAYNLTNYAAACKVCNSVFKKAFFPISASRAELPRNTQNGFELGKLADEQPFLCYPLGETDDDPEDLITFRATTAVPVHAVGHKHARAKVMIDFFGLNEREQLHRERARMIAMFGHWFEKQTAGTANVDDLKAIEKIMSPALPHSACLKAFARLWATDASLAMQTYKICQNLAVGIP